MKQKAINQQIIEQNIADSMILTAKLNTQISRQIDKQNDCSPIFFLQLVLAGMVGGGFCLALLKLIGLT